MASDVVGYSALMGRDEAGTLSAMRALRKELWDPKIGEYGGRVVKSTGDGLLVEFPSVADAVQCAVEVQRAMARRNADIPEDHRIVLRVGINQGDVIVEGDDIFGDGVNVAARLEGLAEPGGICISRAVRDQIRDKLLYALEDLGEQELKNIARPVEVFRVSIEENGDAAGAAKAPPPARAKTPVETGATAASARKPWLVPVATAAVVLLAVIAAGGWLIARDDDVKIAATTPAAEEDPILALPRGPRIAVLPFDNLSGDPEQEYFSDGITEEIITQLSRFSTLFVLARNTTFQFKGQAVDVKDVANKLDVRYVVEGSVRGAEDTVRVTVQLIDAESGTHIWSESYDRPLTAANLFEVQGDIAEKVAAQIGAQEGAISRFARREIRDRRTDNLSAYECVLLSFAYYGKLTPETHLAARDCLERAVELDPGYAEAWGWLAYMYVDETRFGFNARPEQYDSFQRASEAAQRAAGLDSTNQTAQAALALVHYTRRDMDQFRAALERTLKANPNNAGWVAFMGVLLANSGEWERGRQLIQKAQALNPNHQHWYYFPLAFDAYIKGDYGGALVEAQKINLPGLYQKHLLLAAIFGQLGRASEAEQAVGNIQRLAPGYSVQRFPEGLFFNLPSNELEHLRDGLRKAGLPEVSKDE